VEGYPLVFLADTLGLVCRAVVIRPAIDVAVEMAEAVRRPTKDEARIAELERMVGQLTMENSLLKKALSRLEAYRQPARADGGKK
jgi:hypothetical protein